MVGFWIHDTACRLHRSERNGSISNHYERPSISIYVCSWTAIGSYHHNRPTNWRLKREESERIYESSWDRVICIHISCNDGFCNFWKTMLLNIYKQPRSVGHVPFCLPSSSTRIVPRHVVSVYARSGQSPWNLVKNYMVKRHRILHHQLATGHFVCL